MRLLSPAAVLLCMLMFSSTAFPAASGFSGLPVTAIVIKNDLGNPWPHPEQVLPLIEVKPGDHFSSQAIRDGIGYLYLKGLFRDIRVDGFPDGDGVRLEYTLFPITVVDNIVINGNHALSRGKILEVLTGVEGKELREEKLPGYKANIIALYQSEGFYNALVSFQARPLKDPHHVALLVNIQQEGKPTILEEVHFTGNTVFKEKDLLKIMKSKMGDRLRTDLLLDTDVEAIRQKYAKAGYPAAKPGPVNVSFRDGKAYVTIQVSEGPKVTVKFTGNHAFSSSKLRDALLIWSEHDVSDAIIASSTDKIRSLYYDDGYANVSVGVMKTEAPGSLDLEFSIQEGLRETVLKIDVRGNTYFPTKQIKGEMSLRESGWFTSTPYREDLLDRDMDYIHDRYVDAGFLAVSVKKTVTFVEDGKAVVEIDIDEGPQTRTGTVTFEGDTAFTAAELLGIVSLKPGAPYNERLVDEDRYRILSAYSNKGYLYAKVDVEKKTADGTVDIKYKISEDLQVKIGRIILRGNEKTKDSVIMRELLVKPGGPYDYGAVLKSQQRIYRYGYFGLARFEPLHPEEKDYVKDLLLSLEERPAGSVEFGVGYGDLDHFRSSVEVAYRNLWNSAHYAGIRFEESTILSRVVLNYQQPWAFGYNLQGKFALLWSDQKNINSDTREIYYETRSNSASYGVEKALDHVKASLTYQYENVDNYNVEPGAILSPEDVGFVFISSISPSLIWDLRDNIFNPRTGALYGVVIKEALKQLGSEADFTKVSVQSSWYIPSGADSVVALSARVGMAWPHRDTIEVPIHERFYLGGSTTVRGYTQDSVGPQAGSPLVPTGGDSMLLFNAEYRWNVTKSFGLVLFSDAGNVWIGQDLHIDDLRASYGAGIRYGTPIGPLRIDYGQKIHRRPGESPGEIHFNIGHTF
ncbi:MAG TPA: outer membrane protein assembly factor BamA [Nitrospirota bacterium]|nr:outer membrane protein assembly factor BamA [Nitrospirota bacterium]